VGDLDSGQASAALVEAGRRAKEASRRLAVASSAEKDAALLAAASALRKSVAELLEANRADVEGATSSGASQAEVDRLRLTEDRVLAMAEAVEHVAGLADPVGEVVDGWVRPNGVRVQRVRVPLGVVGVIYENRPNVTSDAAALCLKAGNAAMLRGSSSAIRSNRAIAAIMRRSLAEVGLPEDGVVLVEDTSREGALAFMGLVGIIDCLVPRGGPSLLAAVRAHARVPTVIDGEGNCHLYVDERADLGMALEILVNAKTQRPSVCNAVESLVVHRSVAETFLPAAATALQGVELVGDDAARAIVPTMGVATEEDFATEFLGPKLSVAVVDDLDAAIEHVRRYSTGHSEAIVTEDLRAAERFIAEVDAAAVLVNASTRLIDGGELGLGAEIGISTQKLHARGPMGLRELTCVKWVVRGNGQVRT
jgi:glutamate-5-semialdehyde dehydrogenase